MMLPVSASNDHDLFQRFALVQIAELFSLSAIPKQLLTLLSGKYSSYGHREVPLSHVHSSFSLGMVVNFTGGFR